MHNLSKIRAETNKFLKSIAKPTIEDLLPVFNCRNIAELMLVLKKTDTESDYCWRAWNKIKRYLHLNINNSNMYILKFMDEVENQLHNTHIGERVNIVLNVVPNVTSPDSSPEVPEGGKHWRKVTDTRYRIYNNQILYLIDKPDDGEQKED